MNTIEVSLERYEELCRNEARVAAICGYVRHASFPDRSTILIIAGEKPLEE